MSNNSTAPSVSIKTPDDLVRLVTERGADGERLLRHLRDESSSLCAYHDVEWRFEVSIAQRALHRTIAEPLVYLKLTLRRPNGELESHLLQTDIGGLRKLEAELASAHRASKSAHVKKLTRHLK